MYFCKECKVEISESLWKENGDYCDGHKHLAEVSEQKMNLNEVMPNEEKDFPRPEEINEESEESEDQE